MKKALVTGGAGYIGHHLQKELKKNGYYVIVMDRKHPSQLMATKYCDEYIHTDIRNYDHILDEIEYGKMFDDDKFSFDIVFHLAGSIEVGESEEMPTYYYENNVSGTINILKLMKEYGCKDIVFSSSCAAENPESVYGQTKRMCETDGTCIRDYIHVSDLADAHVKAAEFLNESKTSSIFNLGSGTGYSVLDVIAMVEEVTDTDFKIKYSNRRAGDPAKLVCEDVEHSEKILKFKPKYGLKEIIASAYQWEVKQRRTPNATVGVSD